MRKKLILLAVVILLLAVIVWQLKVNTNRQSNEINFQNAVDTLDESYCDNITYEGRDPGDSFFPKGFIRSPAGGFIFDYSRRSCLNEVAKLKNDPVVCKKIKPVKNAVNNCILDIAIYNGNAEACAFMEGDDKDTYKYECYQELAFRLNDSSFCNMTSDKYHADTCLNTISRENQLRSKDYYNLFKAACETGNVSVCEMFEEELGPTYSFTTLCYKCVAIKTNDGAVCSKIQDSVRNDCFDYFKDENFDPNAIFSITNVNCDEAEASLDVTLKQEIRLIDFNLMFQGRTLEFSTGGNTKQIDVSFSLGETKMYKIKYSDYIINFEGPAASIRIAFTTNTGDYWTNYVSC